MVVIHSRAWTVPWKLMAGLEPLPSLPQRWIPVISRSSNDLPAVKISEFSGNAFWRSSRKVRWSS